ncbi:MAG: hypothetical protein JMDDDDMK_02592 [Acidobacteria bacterium]|nr:hypothetical protein [Acidobacteriota bacterium]
MKRYIRAGVLALSLSALPLSLTTFAQTGGYPDNQNTTTYRTDGGAGGGWGWFGLIGLLGLFGLKRRREEPSRHRAGDYRTGEPLGSR